MIEVSQDWTTEERLQVIARFGALIQEKALENPYDPRGWLDYGECITFLATKPASFLEAHRAKILADL